MTRKFKVHKDNAKIKLFCLTVCQLIFTINGQSDNPLKKHTMAILRVSFVSWEWCRHHHAVTCTSDWIFRYYRASFKIFLPDDFFLLVTFLLFPCFQTRRIPL